MSIRTLLEQVVQTNNESLARSEIIQDSRVERELVDNRRIWRARVCGVAKTSTSPTEFPDLSSNFCGRRCYTRERENIYIYICSPLSPSSITLALQGLSSCSSRHASSIFVFYNYPSLLTTSVITLSPPSSRASKWPVDNEVTGNENSVKSRTSGASINPTALERTVLRSMTDWSRMRI